MKKTLVGILTIIASVSFISCNNNNQTNANVNTTNSSINQKLDVSTQNKISLEKAKEIALKHANLTNDQVSFLKANEEFDDGIEKFDIEFYCDNKEYDYDINANTGNIISYDFDIENFNNSNQIQQSTNQSSISMEKAKEIALKHANLTNDKVSFIKVNQEFDDGIEKYDIEFYCNNKEYNYEINSNTGEIVSYEFE
ncbi:PepSY domain-containing protein [Clostridium perfringens]|uniref:PepSY domain-containing protein n=1 Tax=Clostridium perfringens TaxID=1502 RepID=UPI0024BC6D4A|nr:PepSY domain-containing protein [Clostridium perfringens]